MEGEVSTFSYLLQGIFSGLKFTFTGGLLIYTIFIVVIVLLAATGQSVGVRRFYVYTLLQIFQWGRQKIEKEQRSKEQVKVIEREVEDRTADDSGLHSDDSDRKYSGKPVIGGHPGIHVIDRELPLRASEEIRIPYVRSLNSIRNDFQLNDAMFFCKSGLEAIIEDEVTQRFAAEELHSWNFLTRSNYNYQYLSLRLTVLWCIGFFFRYCCLLPLRLSLTIVGVIIMLVGTALVGLVPDGRLKRILYRFLSLTVFRIFARAFSAVVTFHNRENMATSGGICVANHTSPIDVVFLHVDNCYALVGQRHGGFIGLIQTAFSRAASHIWFERAEVKDRTAVATRLRNHVEDESKLPILIFPEGTCINNTSVMMFKKGSFEVGGTIYPAAIKYDSRFADPFWNSSLHGMVHHVVRILTSWAIVCDVWYLEPQIQKEGEEAIDFANRVKKEIAMKGGLVDLEWDGQLKRARPKPTVLQRKQQEYSKILKGD